MMWELSHPCRHSIALARTSSKQESAREALEAINSRPARGRSDFIA